MTTLKTVLLSSAIFLLLISISSAQTATLEQVTLSRNSVPTYCPVARERPDSVCNKKDGQIEVVASVRNPKNEPVQIIYFASGGEIIGSGPRVIWDLHQARPGNHSITVGIGEGMVIRGKTITKPVEKYGCPICDPPCECPTLEIRAPDSPITAGDAFIVEADLRGGQQEPDPKYRWTVSEGTIIDGQGASRVLIRTDSKSPVKPLEVRLEIEAVGLCPACPRTALVSVPVLEAKPKDRRAPRNY